MGDKPNPAGLRLLTAALLALSAVPIGLAWHRRSVEEAAAYAMPPTAQTDAEWIVPGALEVELKPGTDDSALAELSARIGVPLRWNTPDLHSETEIAAGDLPAGANVEADLQALRADPRVQAADVEHLYREPEGEMESVPVGALSTAPDEETGRWQPNDPRFKEQWNFRMVKAEQAWETTKGKGAVVAVIDTGVAYKDTKKGKLGRDFGDTKFVEGYDFVNRDALPNDDQGHGTHVAGTIAESTDNGEGVAGLAFEAKIMPLKVLNSAGGGMSKDIAEAIRWAADHGANVINMSLGSPYPDRLMGDACAYAKQKGVTIVCAAGNSGREGVGYPAAYKDCIAVSSVGPKGDLSFYSTWGKQIAVAAPGGDKQVGGEAGGILQNTVMKDENGALQDDYFAFQGTSMASPHVAAVAALIVSQGVKNPDDVKAILQKSAQKKGPKDKYGAGIVDAAAASEMAAKTFGDGVTRFWLVVALFAGCYGIGRMRKGVLFGPRYPFWGTAALAFGLLFPDWLTGYLGQSSPYNIVGHSILIPGALLLMGAQKMEKRLLGWMALGMGAHVAWEFLRGTSPFGPEVGAWQMLPWVTMNVVSALGMLLAGLTADRD